MVQKVITEVDVWRVRLFDERSLKRSFLVYFSGKIFEMNLLSRLNLAKLIFRRLR